MNNKLLPIYSTEPIVAPNEPDVKVKLPDNVVSMSTEVPKSKPYKELVGKDLIGVDEGSREGGEVARLESGKYLYEFPNGKFDIDRFNRDFSQYKEKRKLEMESTLQNKLDKLNYPEKEIPAYDLSIGQLTINMKDALFDIMDDIINFDVTGGTFLRHNRLIYIGLILILIACIIFFYFMFN